MYKNYMSKAAKNNEYTPQSGYLIFENEQLFNEFLAKFGKEFLINMRLEETEKLNEEIENPAEWSVCLNKKKQQININQITENISHIIETLYENSLDIIDNENMATNNSLSEPKLGIGMHSKDISHCAEPNDESDKESRSSEEEEYIPPPSPEIKETIAVMKIKIPVPTQKKCQALNAKTKILKGKKEKEMNLKIKKK